MRFYVAEIAAVRTLIGSVQIAAEMGQIRDLETGMHLTGGTAQQKLVLDVKMADGTVVSIPADEAMKDQ